MSRLFARDHLNNGDIQLYAHDEVDGQETAVPAELSAAETRQVEFESVDILSLGAYLLFLAAQDQAQALVAVAEREATEIRQQAAQQGAEQGRAEAREAGLPALVAFADAAQSLIVFEEQLISRCTPQIVRLALEIAQKVVGKALSEEPAIIASVLERAKREVAEAKEVRVRLHPDDFRFLAEARPDLVRMGGESGRLFEILPSEEISRGGCRLETEVGVVDATIPTQLEEIRRQLLDDGWQDHGAQSLGPKPEI